MKLPEDCLEGDSWIGYMLSASVDMSSQGSDPSAQKRMKHTDDSNSFKAFESEEGGCNLQKIQYDSEDYSLIGNYYTDDYARFIEDNKSIRRRYTEVQKSPGFIRIGEVYISFSKNKVTFDGRNIILYLREIQALRFLALWYPDLVSYEQIYYNLSFGVKKIYVSVEIPAMKKRYITRLVGYVQTKLRSVTDGILISSSYGKGYSLVCYSNQQACPNESSVQDALHSQSTGSSS
jgi:DNA-binding winged helix-turn-helix (wHTH) protein